MLESSAKGSTFRLLNVAAYFAIAAVGIAGITNMPPGSSRGVALALLVIFGGLHILVSSATALGEHRRLHLCLALETAVISLLAVLDRSSLTTSTYFCILFFISSAAAMLRLPQRTAIVWIGIYVLASAAVFIYVGGFESGLRNAVTYGSGYFFFGAFAAALKRAQAAQSTSARLLEELRVAHGRLQEYAGRVERLAVIEERNRLAREMHDSIGHRLTVASVQLEGAQRLIARDPERATGIVATVREQVRDALGELRQTVATLRQPVEVDLALPQAMERLVASFSSATDIAVHLDLQEGIPDLEAPQRLALYRAAQEGLTNVQRHSNARNVWLSLSCEGGEFSLMVEDDGVGYPDTGGQTGFGLLGIRERVERLGGRFCLGERPGGGARLMVSIPLLGDEDGRDG